MLRRRAGLEAHEFATERVDTRLTVHGPYLNDPEDLGLRLGRSRRFEEVSPESFALLARRVGAPVGETMEAVARVARNLEEAWAQTSQLPAPLPQHRAWLDTRIPEVARRFSG